MTMLVTRTQVVTYQTDVSREVAIALLLHDGHTGLSGWTEEQLADELQSAASKYTAAGELLFGRCESDGSVVSDDIVVEK